MAVLACASRFAVLKLEDDEVNETLNKKPTNSTTQNSVQGTKNKNATKSGSNDQKSKAKKKKKNAIEIAELQNLAFGSTKNKHKPSSGQSKIVSTSAKQWEEWKQKDSEFVSEVYEQDLQEALILSKIDYEEKKDVYDAIQKDGEQNRLKKKKKGNQKKDKAVMSLDEFQSLNSTTAPSPPPITKEDIPVADSSDFFDKIEEETSKIITKEQRQETVKVVDHTQESARILQFQEDLRLKDEEIATLNATVTKLKDELKSTKMRNKKLYGILECGETREKAEILVQIDQLTAVKDELTDQLSEYHTALEQERSKVHALQTELRKGQNSKKQRTESK